MSSSDSSKQTGTELVRLRLSAHLTGTHLIQPCLTFAVQVYDITKVWPGAPRLDNSMSV